MTLSEKRIGFKGLGLHSPRGLFIKNLKTTRGRITVQDYKIYWTTNLRDYVVETTSHL